MKTFSIWRTAKAFAALAAVSALFAMQPAHANGFAVTPLASNLFVENDNPADNQLINPWGLALSPTGPFWISDNGTGLSTLYDGAGAKLSLVVRIPPPAGQPGPSTPDGIVYNGTPDFQITVNNVIKPASFIFATEDGTISAWAGGPVASLVIDKSKLNAVYKGLALLSTPSGNWLFATDFHNRRIDVFNAIFDQVATITTFDVPRKFAPFGIAALNGKVYVTFAEQDNAEHDDVAGPGNGYVEVIDPSVSLTPMPFIAHGTLNSPWGLAIAPASFGKFAGDLLVGNFGDGTLHAYDLTTGVKQGAINNTTGKPIFIDGLWAITPGNDHDGGCSQNIYFTAGPNAESNGLFGVIAPSP
jgi:uncharacterized protein (TIGR03118 family)